MMPFLEIITTFALLVLSNQSELCFPSCSCTGIKISCSGMMLQEVPVFKNINGANIIDLSDNQIEVINAEELHWRGVEQLQYLYLNVNSLVYIGDNSLERFNNLEYLDLSNNILEQIQGNLVEANHRLSKLNLAGNSFGSNVPIIKSVSLTYLDISHSKLTHFGVEHIQYLPNLKYVNIQANNIAFLSSSFYMINQNIQKILNRNTWACNCSTVDLYNWSQHDNSISIGEDFSCKSDNQFLKFDNEENLFQQFCAHERNSTDLVKTNSSKTISKLSLIMNSDCDRNSDENCTDNFNYHHVTEVILLLVLICILLAFVLGYLLAQYMPKCKGVDIFCSNKRSAFNI